MRTVIPTLTIVILAASGCGSDATSGTADTPKSCAAIKAANGAATDGTYMIDPDGSGAGAPFNVYCDMTTDGGGWTALPLNFADTKQWSITQSGTMCIAGPTLGDGKTLSWQNQASMGWNYLSFTFAAALPVSEVYFKGLVHSTSNVSNNMDILQKTPAQDSNDTTAEGWYFADGDPMAPIGYVFAEGCVTDGYLDPGAMPAECSMSKPGSDATVKLTRKIKLSKKASRFQMVAVEGCGSNNDDPQGGNAERFYINHPSSVGGGGGVWKDGILVR